MPVRIALFALMALGLAGFGTVAWIATRAPKAHHAMVVAPPAKVAVLVAAHPLKPGALLQPGDLAAESVLATAVPTGATKDSPADRAGLIGAMVRRSMLKGQTILPLDVMRPGDHGFLSAVLAPGMRAVTVGIDDISGGAGLIWPGDMVDLVLTQQIHDANLPLGERLAAETVLTDVRVIAIGQRLMQGEEPNGVHNITNPARTATLEVTPLEAEQVAVASRLGPLSLVVRSADHSTQQAENDPPAIAWAGEVSPALKVATPAAAAPGKTLDLFRGAATVEKVHF